MKDTNPAVVPVPGVLIGVEYLLFLIIELYERLYDVLFYHACYDDNTNKKMCIDFCSGNAC